MTSLALLTWVSPLLSPTYLMQVGGQVKFYGMPGGTNTPSWTKLAQTAKKGAQQITVQDDVSGWPVNKYIVVTSTDFFPEQAEVFKILAGGQVNASFC